MVKKKVNPEQVETNDVVSEGFASVPEAADYLSTSRGLIYKLMGEQRLPFAKFGRSRRIPWTALRAYARDCLVGQA